VYHARELETLLLAAIRKKGMSVVEVIQQCPTYYGRYNRQRSPVEMLNWQKDNTINIKQLERMKPEHYEGKILRGILFEKEAPEFCETYKKFVERVQEGGSSHA